MSEDVYQQLRSHLDRLPGGYPATDTGVEMRLLYHMFTPDEARTALRMGPVPEPAAVIASRLGEDEAGVRSRLDAMNRKASIMSREAPDGRHYSIWHFLIGVWEGQMIYADEAFVRMANEYMPYLAREFASIETQQTRVIPIGSSLPMLTDVEPWDEVERLIAGKDKIVVAPCVCCKESELGGPPCEHTSERCIAFGSSADFWLYHGKGRRIDQTELRALLKLGEEEGLVLNVSNARDSDFICMCCGHHCVLLKMLKLGGLDPGEQVRSSFYATIDSAECTVCDRCVDRCQMRAIEITPSGYQVEQKRCIGCGICLSTCEYDAVSMIRKPEQKPVYDDAGTLYAQMMRERGLLPPAPRTAA